jgi:hypothetical protein
VTTYTLRSIVGSREDIQPALREVLAHSLGVAPTYRHAPKQVSYGETVAKSRCVLKWYEVSDAETPVPDDIRALARAPLENGRLDVDGFGFVVLHRCGKDFYFLVVVTWRNENELWETIWYKDGDTMREFGEFPRVGTHKVTLCVWELAPVWHERQSWVRFLLSKRDLEAAERWLSDLYSGVA